jgi:competence ComEA-like helix-hairpin-helix protein
MTNQRQNRIQSFAFVISACAALCFSLFFIPNLLITRSECFRAEAGMDERINPNTAEAASLVRLPDVGFSLAEAIIQYRNNFVENNNRRAFESLDDLQNVKGLGPARVQNLKEFLKFD